MRGNDIMLRVDIWWSLSVLVGVWHIAAAEGPAQSDLPAVAIVSTLSGTASQQKTGSTELLPVTRFEWLLAGTQLQVGRHSRLIVVFSDGQRYELGERARATLTRKGLASSAGPLQRLPALPPLPALAGISPADAKVERAGAVRLRAGPDEVVQNLYPSAGTTSVAESTTLRFSPVDNARLYEWEVEDEAGRTVYMVRTSATQLALPAGTLQPGHRYYWEVKALREGAVLGRGEAEFDTLTAEQSQARAKLKARLTRQSGSAGYAFLAVVDRQLGLLAEARQELEIAVARASRERDLIALLETLKARLGE
jgi:hypothetical protein